MDFLRSTITGICAQPKLWHAISVDEHHLARLHLVKTPCLKEIFVRLPAE